MSKARVFRLQAGDLKGKELAGSLLGATVGSKSGYQDIVEAKRNHQGLEMLVNFASWCVF